MSKVIKVFAILLPIVFLSVTKVNASSSDAIQTVTGEVTATGTFSQDIEKESGVSGMTAEKFGSAADQSQFIFQGNKVIVKWLDLYGAGEDFNDPALQGGYMVMNFDDDGNLVSTQFTRSGTYNDLPTENKANVCTGDDNACKNMAWGYLHVNNPRTLTCGFTCDHKNDYAYTFEYQGLNTDNEWKCLDASSVNKCKDIKVAFTPSAEWFANLKHECISEGSGSKLYTVDLISPPTPFLSCTDQGNCLGSAAEYQLTTSTWGKGAQKTQTGFVEATQNSLNSGGDSTIKCSNGTCVAYTSGARVLKATAPQTSYFGQCRGTAGSETVDGKAITTPAVTINTNEAAIPEVSNSLNLNVINRPPVATVSLDKDTITTGEEINATCDIVDPDACSDKIVKVKWSCFNNEGKQVGCYFIDSNGIFQQGTTTEEIPDDKATNPYRSVKKFKSSVAGNYTVVCEGSDDDVNNPATSAQGIGGVVVNNGGVVSASTCIVTRTKPSLDINTVNLLDEVKYQANTIGGDAPVGYDWKCDKNASTSPDHHTNSTKVDEQSCKYSQEGAYEPQASCDFKDDKGNVYTQLCVNAQNTGVRAASANTNTNSGGEKSANVKACNVQLSSNGTSYLKELSASLGDSVTARVVVTDGLAKSVEGMVTWKFDNVVFPQKGQKITKIMDKSGVISAQASVTNKDGSVVDCNGASINVSEKVKWGVQ